jgi:hypothetical protein
LDFRFESWPFCHTLGITASRAIQSPEQDACMHIAATALTYLLVRNWLLDAERGVPQ